MWKIEIRSDLAKGKWNDLYKTFVYWKVYYIIAKGKGIYIHYKHFLEDEWDSLCRLVDKIEKAKDFTPEEKPTLWFKVVDSKKSKVRVKKLYKYWYLK